MAANSSTPTTDKLPSFAVGEWKIESGSQRLSRDGQAIKLEPKVMRVLVYLAERQGRVVSREELESDVWAGRVVTYDAVTNTIIKLRRAFGDDPKEPRYIETISKNGYRLIPQVTWNSPSPDDLPARIEKEIGTDVPGWLERNRIGVVFGTVALALAGGWALLSKEEQAPLPAQTASGEPPSIAVLPFDNLSGDPTQDYFSDGITEDLITDLSKVSGLLVLARNSVFAYKGSTLPEQEIGKELKASHLLKGSVRKEGDRVRINVRLVDAIHGGNRWAERYDHRLDDIFAIQDKLTAQIVSAMEVELAPSDRRRLTRNHIASVEAYDAFLRGLDFYGRRSEEDNRQAKEHFQQAIDLDPLYARAYTGLALAYTRDFSDSWSDPDGQSMKKANELARRAAELDNSVPQVRFVLSQQELYARNYSAAIDQIEQAIQLKPSYADGYAMLAWTLHFAGRPEEGFEALQRAVRLNPRVPAIYRGIFGALHYELGNTQEAIGYLEEGTEISPNYQLLRVLLTAAYSGAGMLDEAQWQAEEVLALNPDFSLKDMEQVYPIRNPLYMERMIADLKRAGLH